MTARPSSSALGCTAGVTALCQPPAPSAVAGATQQSGSKGGQAPGLSPPVGPYPQRPAEAACPAASREEAGREAVQGRQRVLSGCRAAGAGVAVVPPGAETGQQVPTKHRTVHLYLGILWAPGRGQVRPLTAPPSLPTLLSRTDLPRRAPRAGRSPSCQPLPVPQRRRARAAVPAAGAGFAAGYGAGPWPSVPSAPAPAASAGSRGALSAGSRPGRPCRHSGALSTRSPAEGSRAERGPPPSPGCEAGHGEGGSAWWNGPVPRPPAPAASAAPGSTGAGLSCGRAGQGTTRWSTRGGHGHGHGHGHPLPHRSPRYLCFSSALCTDLREKPPLIRTGATGRRRTPRPASPPSPPLTGRCPRPGGAARGRPRHSRARLRRGRARAGAGPPRAPAAPGTRRPAAAPGCW